MHKKFKLNPENFELECSTVWSFPKRGNWASHQSNWRGNWAPEIARNLILRYSNEGDWLLDPMIGGGTTAIEAKILNRNIIIGDINDNALGVTKKAIDFEVENKSIQIFQKNDARCLTKIRNDSIDFLLTHPPYADIIKYSDSKINEDLSNIKDLKIFVEEMHKVASEFYRVLKKGKFCAILMGDTRKNKMYQPLAFGVMQKFIDVGFALKEDIVKLQHNCKATGFWKNKSKDLNFLLIMHEHLFIFQK